MGVQNFPFWQLGQKGAHPKNTAKIGVQQSIVWKTDVRHETAIFRQKKRNSSYHFLPYSLLFQQKTQNVAETPILECFSKPKKRDFSNVKLKTEKFGKKMCTHFLKKAIFENWQIIGHKKRTKW